MKNVKKFSNACFLYFDKIIVITFICSRDAKKIYKEHFVIKQKKGSNE